MPKATLTHSVKRISTHENRTEGIINYDIDNNYPNRVRDILDNSGMGSVCALLYGKYIYGRGFQDTEFAKMVINENGLTNDQLFKLIKDDKKNIGGYAIIVNYNSFFEPCNFYYQPISHIRFTPSDDKDNPNMFAVNKHYGTPNKVDKKNTQYFNKFNTNIETIQREIDAVGGIENYNGQILYITNVIGNYPKPIYDAVLEDMQTDGSIKTYNGRNISTNFMASHVVTIDPIEGSADPNSTVEQEKSKFIESLEEFQGADNANKIIVLEKDSIAQNIKFEKVDQQDGDGKFKDTEDSVQTNIRRAFLIPSILIDEEPTGFNVNPYNDAVNVYNGTTSDERLEIEETFRKLFEYHPSCTTTNFSVLQKPLIAKDDAVKRKEIIELVKDTELTNSQKILLLVNEYDMDNEDAVKLIFPVDNILKTIAQRLEGNQLEQLTKVLADEYLTREDKTGILTQIYGLTQAQALIIFPATEPDVVNPSAPPTQ